MSVFNAQNASVFGLTAQQLYNIFLNQSNQTPGVTSIANSFATVFPFSGSTQTATNAQSIEDLFPSINSGSNTYFNLNGGPATGTQEHFGVPTVFTYPANSSYFGVLSNTATIQIIPPNNAVANLSTSTQTSNEQVAEGQLQFIFIPGSTQSLALTYQTGTSISNAVANGITNSTTTGTTTTVTTGVTVTGLFPGGSAAVNTSASEAWLQQSQQMISYTDTQTNQVNTNVSTTVTVNVNTATPNSNGQYTWTNLQGQSFQLIPGQQYVAAVFIDQTAFNTPVPNTFQITGPTMTLPMELVISKYKAVSPGLPPLFPPGMETNVINPSLPLSYNAEQAISAANSLGYSQYSNIDASLFTYTSSPIALVNYTGLISSATTTGTTSSIEILPVATTSNAQILANTVSNEPNSSSMEMQNTSIPGVSNSATNLSLKSAAEKLSSNRGVFYDNTSTEFMIKTQKVNLSGDNHDIVKVGNLDYNFSNFSNSQITTGSGYNHIIITSSENNNSFTLGNGNNKVTLNGNGNNVRLGNGANYVEIDGSTGKNYLIAGNGPEVVKINSSSGFTQISNWDNTQDYLCFADNIKLSDVRIKFDHNNWSYDVYVADKLIANIITKGGLTYADANSTVYPSTYWAPLPYNIKSNAGFINGIYADIFDAQPDVGGLTFWTNQLNSGASRTAVIQAFLTSPQFNAEHHTNSLYVDAVYQDLLGRPAETAGLNYWTNQLNTGLSKVALVGAVLNSSEFTHLVGSS